MLKIICLGLVTLSVVVLVGCGLDKQAVEAQKITDEINVINEKYNQLSVSSSELFNKLFGDKLTEISKSSELKDYKEKNSAEFNELLDEKKQLIKLANEISDKYSQVLKLKLSDKYKEYVKVNIESTEKLAESDKLMTGFVNSFLETQDIDKLNNLIENYEKKSAELEKETENLKEQSRKFIKENPGEIENQ